MSILYSISEKINKNNDILLTGIYLKQNKILNTLFSISKKCFCLNVNSIRVDCWRYQSQLMLLQHLDTITIGDGWVVFEITCKCLLKTSHCCIFAGY